MEPHVWAAYGLAALLISVSPGSGALLTMAHSMARGVRGSTPAVLGLQVGLVAILWVSGVGLGALLLASEQAFTALKGAGAAYLVWLGWSQWRSASGPVAPPGGRRSVAVDTPAFACFVQGVLTNVTNPKGIVFMVAVLPQFIDPQRPLWLQLGLMSATSVGVDFGVMRWGYAPLAQVLQRLMARPGALRWRGRLFGGTLMGLGVSLLFVRRVGG